MIPTNALESWPALPIAGTPKASAPVTLAPVGDMPTLRERLKATARGKRGEGWAAWRHVAAGERMFRLEGGPGGEDLYLVHGVDEFISKEMLWPLAGEPEWTTVPGEEIATLMGGSLGILRDDAQEVGTPSKFYAPVIIEKWQRAAEKAYAERAQADAWLGNLTSTLEAAAAARDHGLPLIAQLDDRYFVLDDRATPRYEGPAKAQAVPGLAKFLWADKGRELNIIARGEIRPMNAAELAANFAAPITSIATEYQATAPRVDDLTLVRPAALELPKAVYDSDVEAWLHLLDPEGAIDGWLCWADPRKAGTLVPVLTMVGASHVGKGLLAFGTAAAAGMAAPTPLRRALGQFKAALGDGPVLFGDEGLPRQNGVPQTQEFRELVTATIHRVEQKGLDKSATIRGGVRCILAANRIDRLFSGKGTLGADDIAALLRRLFVVAVEGPRALEAHKAAVGLGAFEGDPARLARVAGHIRWLHEQPFPPPEPREGGGVGRELRGGNDVTTDAFAALEDGFPSDWTAAGMDAGAAVLWVRLDVLGTRTNREPAALGRALSPYTIRQAAQTRTHPVTKKPLERRQRWTGLDLVALVRDGIDLDTTAISK